MLRAIWNVELSSGKEKKETNTKYELGGHEDKVCYCFEADSMAAIHGDDIIAEGEPEKLNRLDEVLKQLVVVKVLDRIRPGAVEHGQYPEEALRVHRRAGIRVAGRSETPCCDHQKPFQHCCKAAELTGKQGSRKR